MKTNRPIESMILTLRGQKVILDSDLAALYGVATSRLNEQVKRNASRFPDDFVFQLTLPEWTALMSQIAISNAQILDNIEDKKDRSQNSTGGRGGRRKLPFAFTEHGAIMAASVLNSPEAVAMSIYVVRAFILMRQQIAANAEVLKRLAEIDKTLLQHDKALQTLWGQLKPLLAPPTVAPKHRIGFTPEKKP